eukprot:gene11243-11045_t
MPALTSSPSVKIIGANGQISLGKQFAGRQVLVEEKEAGVWLIRTATVIPDNERWNQLYRDNGLKWEKIASVKPPPGIDAIYSLRITQSRRCTAHRDGDFMRLLTVSPDHDSTYGRK